MRATGASGDFRHNLIFCFCITFSMLQIRSKLSSYFPKVISRVSSGSIIYALLDLPLKFHTVSRDLPGSPVVKTSQHKGESSVPLVEELRSHMPCGQKTKCKTEALF